MDTIQLGFAYKDFFELPSSTGYETLIYNCLIGDQMLFQRPIPSETAGEPCSRFWVPGEEIVDGYEAVTTGLTARMS